MIASLALVCVLSLVPALSGEAGEGEESGGGMPEWLQTGALIAGGAFGLWQYAEAQVWKRAEFAAGLMKDFFDSPGVRKAQMLVWQDPRVELLPAPAPALEELVARAVAQGVAQAAAGGPAPIPAPAVPPSPAKPVPEELLT